MSEENKVLEAFDRIMQVCSGNTYITKDSEWKKVMKDEETLRTALTELKAARQSGVPDGWVLVPREPTEEIEGLDEAIELAEFRRLNRNMETQRVSLPTRCLDTLLKAARQGRGG